MKAVERRFRFEGDLRLFLPPHLRGVDEFIHTSPGTDSLTHVIESLGVPHTEFGEVRERDGVFVVSPRDPERVAEEARFVLDGHLGRLARYLRLLGFDALRDPHPPDDELADLASREHRILLTRDTGLLKRSEVTRGYFVRSTAPREQAEEVVRRYSLRDRFRPFTRCLECNGPLLAVAKDQVRATLPARTSELHDEFTQCPDCRRVYWKGSHYERMMEWIETLRRG